MHQSAILRIVRLFGISALITSHASANLLSGQFVQTGSDLTPRIFHRASTLPDGTVLVSGGLNLSIFPLTLISLNNVTFFDPATQQFSSTYSPLLGGNPVGISLATARSSQTQTTLLDGRVLFTGGNVGASGLSPGVGTNSAEIFDPFSGQLNLLPTMSAARAMHTATLLRDGRVVVAGGSGWQIFDPNTDSWSVNRSLLRTRSGHTAVLLPNFGGITADDRILLVAGSGSGAQSMELINPTTLSSTLMSSSFTIGLNDLAATRLADGNVFIVGGQNTSTGDTVADTYLFDPVNDVLSSGPDVPNRVGGISDHQLVRAGHYVVILGGEQQLAGTDTILDYAAVFDGENKVWLEDGSMLGQHDDFAVAPLGGCETLIIAGGVPFLGQPLPIANCEILTVTVVDSCQQGDITNDGVRDVLDFDAITSCLTGPSTSWLQFRCWEADLDADNDADVSDLAWLQRLVDG